MGNGLIRQEDLHDTLQNELYKPNLLANGDFQLWHHGTTITKNAGFTAADNWFMDSGAANSTVSKGEDPTVGNYMRITTPGYANPRNTVDPNILQQIKGKKVTVSFYARRVSGTFTNAAYNLFSQYVGNAADLTNDWQKFTFTITPSASIVIGAIVLPHFRVNNTETVTWDIAQVKVELNDHATPFVPRSYKREVLECSDNPGYAPNILINGDFQVWQRGTEWLKPSGLYTADRWVVANSVDSNVKINQANNTLRMEAHSAVGGVNAYSDIIQKIENPALYAGKTVTLSINIVPDEGVTPVMYIWDGIKYISRVVTTSGVVSITGPISTAPSLLQVMIRLNRDGLAIGKGFNIHWAKLEINNHPSPYIPRNYGEELTLCQRYYELANSGTHQYGAVRTVHDDPGVSAMFRVRKRVAPTVKIYDINGNVDKYWIIGTGNADIGQTLTYPDGFRVVLPTNGAGTENVKVLSYTADAEL